MSTKAADEPKCESVTAAQSVESSVSLECTLKPSDEFLQVFQLSHTFNTNRSTLTTKQIKTMETKMNKLYNKVTNSKNATLIDIITLAYSYQNVCHGYIKTSKQKKELRIVRDYTLCCLNLVKGKELCPKSILVALQGYFQLSFICFEQEKTEEAIKTCNKGIELYLAYTHEIEKYGNPIFFGNFVSESPLDGYYLLNVMYRDILELLIDADTNIDDHNLMVYSHLLLAAELNIFEEKGNYLEWIQTALKICNSLSKRGRFAEARSHIITAIYVKSIYFKDKRFFNMEGQTFVSEKGKLGELKLDVVFIITWLIFTTNLLRTSVERLLRLETDEEFEINNLKSGHTTRLEGDTISQKLLLFNDIDAGIQLPYRNLLIPVKYISHYDDAYKLFINILRNVSFVRSVFYIDKCSDVRTYIHILSDSYVAYKYMALYEKHVTNRSILQNGIVDLLSEAVKSKILLTRVTNWRFIQFYLAFSYSSLINVKLENLDAIHPLYMPERHNTILLEIQCLVRNALTHLKMITLGAH